MEGAARDGISEAAFQTAKRRLESMLAIRSQYTLGYAFYGALSASLDLPARSLTELQARVAVITLQDVNRQAKRVLPRFRIWTATTAVR